jgi:hypothetical protein
VEGHRRPWRSRARRGTVGGAGRRRRLGEASALEGTADEGLWRASDGGVLAVRARQRVDNGDGDGARACFGQCLAARGWRGDG